MATVVYTVYAAGDGEDAEKIPMSSAALNLSTTLQHMLQDLSDDSSEAIPVAASAPVLKAFVAFCEHCAANGIRVPDNIEEARRQPTTDAGIKGLLPWYRDTGFANHDELMFATALLKLCNFLACEVGVFELTRSFGRALKDKPREGIVELFGVKGKITKAHMERVAGKHPWATFDGWKKMPVY